MASAAATQGVVRTESHSTRVERGRMFNALCETYALPADDEEFSRLNKQHMAFVLSVGGLYPDASVVRAVLAPRDGEQKKILELGYGTGAWTISMAKEFPHTQVVGVDLIDGPTTTLSIPPNCTFLKGDINQGLSAHYGQYSFVHARHIGSGLKNFRAVLEDMQKCLKPGGILLVIEPDFDLYGPETETFVSPASEENPNGSWATRIVAELARAVGKFGGDLNAANQAVEEGLWDSPLMDPETCKTASVWCPVGPWKDDEDPIINERLKYAGELLKDNIMGLYRGGSAVIIKAGWPEATVKEWVEKADQEVASMNPPLWTRARFAWGRRRSGPEEPAPALPQPAQTANTSSSTVKPYPEFHEYKTKEVSLAAQARRNEGKDVPLPPYPS